MGHCGKHVLRAELRLRVLIELESLLLELHVPIGCEGDDRVLGLDLVMFWAAMLDGKINKLAMLSPKRYT